MRNAMPDGDSITVRAGFGLTASTHSPLSGLQPLVVQKSSPMPSGKPSPVVSSQRWSTSKQEGTCIEVELFQP